MLDEKGRLFGKINIVDLLIIVVVIAAIAFVGIRYVLPDDTAEVPQDKIQIKVYVDSTYRFVAEGLEKGATVYDSSDKIHLGTLTDWTVLPYCEPVVGAGGANAIMAEIPHKCAIDLVFEMNGSYGEHGATVDGYLLGVGHTMVFYIGECKLFGAVEAISVLE